MSDSNLPKSQEAPEDQQSFEEVLSQYERAQAPRLESGSKQIEGTVIAVTADSVLLDIGYKSEGILPLAEFQNASVPVKPGDKIPVSVTGRDPEGYYTLSRAKVRRPTDWSALEKAFAEGAAIMGTVTAVVKGGLSVDVGVRAFMPASRSGVRDAAELEKLVGQEIRCRITKLDVTGEDVVVDRRAVIEDEDRGEEQRRYSELKEGDTVRGTIRNLTEYGAFVDIGGVDGLLHVADISWTRVNKPADLLSVGQELEAQVLKIDTEKRRISLGLKQLQPHPWDAAGEKYKPGERVRGTVTRVAGFGAFVELEPGIEGLIHISEMSWTKKVRTPADVVKPGDVVEVVILGVNPAEHRLSLGLKQAMGDPWVAAAKRLSAGSAVEGRVARLVNFGAFVEVAEGVEGLIHVSEISAEKRVRHPQDELKAGQTVRAQVLSIDPEKRLLRLSMKQLVPTSLDEYLAEHKVGDVVTGRTVNVSGGYARVELGEGIIATCRVAGESAAKEEGKRAGKADLSSLSSMLKERWKGGGGSAASKPQALEAGQVRSFRISKLDAAEKQIEVEVA